MVTLIAIPSVAINMSSQSMSLLSWYSLYFASMKHSYIQKYSANAKYNHMLTHSLCQGRISE